MSTNPAVHEERWEEWVGRLLSARPSDQNRAAEGSPRRSTSEDRGLIARVRRGLDPLTESRAYADVLPFADGGRTQEKALLRASALVAHHPRLLQSTGAYRTSLGRQLFQVTVRRDPDLAGDPKHPDAIASRLSRLEDEPLDRAALTLHRLFTLAENVDGDPIYIDWYDLTRTLLRWGARPTPQARRHRAQVLRDYYTSTRISAAPASSASTPAMSKELS